MTNPFIAGVGGILSADIAVPDHERVTRFYSQTLTTGASPLWREDLMNNQGTPIIGLGARSEDLDALPLQWMPHIQVRDVGDSAKRALELGGRVVMQSEDGDGAFPWAVLLDPQGAAFGVIPAVPADAIPQLDTGVGPIGHIAWLDLTVEDAAGTRDFYCDVVGWSAEDVPMQDGDTAYADYNMLAAAGRSAAGICHARGTNKGQPPVWMLYLPVGDLAESVRRVKGADGKVLKEIKGGDGQLAYAVIEDPAGAKITLAQG